MRDLAGQSDFLSQALNPPCAYDRSRRPKRGGLPAKHRITKI